MDTPDPHATPDSAALVERTRELAALLEISASVNSTMELQPLLGVILEQLKQIIAYDGAAIYTLRTASELLLLTHQVTGPHPEVQRTWRLAEYPVHAQVIQSHQPVVIPDAQADEALANAFRRTFGQHGGAVRSWMGVPLIVRDRVIGMLAFDHRQPGAYTQALADLALVFAHQVAIAIDNARLYAETRQRVDELQALFAVQQAITSRLSLDEVLRLIVDEGRRLTRTHRCTVALFEGHNMRVAAVSGRPNPDMDVGFVMPIVGSPGEDALRAGKPVLYDNVPGYANPIIAQRVHSKRVLVMPLISGSGPVGAMAISDKVNGEEFGPEDERALIILSTTAVIGLENARLYEAEQARRREAEQRRRVAESLRDILNTLNSDRELDDVLDMILVQACELLGTGAAALFRLDAEGGLLTVQAARGLAPEHLSLMSVGVGQGIVGRAVLEHRPVCVPDLMASSITDELLRDPQRHCLTQEMVKVYQAVLAVPLFIKDTIYGGIVLYYVAAQQFSPEEIELASVFGDQVALAIENARLRTQTQEAAASAERQRIARELHDAVTQTLFSASLIAEILPRLWDENPSAGRERLTDLRRLTRGALAEMRMLLLELRPVALVETPLNDLIRQLVEALTGRTRLNITMAISGECSLPSEVQVNLYRIAQEALNNVLRHAKARSLDVELRSAGGCTMMRIADDGRGFDLDAVPSDHFGLRIMRERSAAVSAELRIESQPGAGTRITVIWPRDSKAMDA